MSNAPQKENSSLLHGGVTVSDQSYTSEKGSLHHFHVIKHNDHGIVGSPGMSREVSFHVIPEHETTRKSSTLANQIRENEFAAANGLLQPEKTINFFESFALISNNISGPAMMGLPHLFHVAGVVPVVVAIVLVFFASSLVGTLMADAIASIPGNHDYQRNLSFSKAFKIILGGSWTTIAESFFLVSCLVQACAAIVETAQSLDGFIASFFLGKTYGLQILPSPMFVEWSGADCHVASEGQMESTLEDCVPFSDAGSLVLTLGFVVTTCLFLPFGRYQLKEAVFIQILSFFCFWSIMGVFHYELFEKGLLHPPPLVGSDVYQVAGVVLFNYAFSVTVPSWLNEKRSDVSVNQTIWGASAVCSVVFVTFGLLAATVFERPGANVLVVLSSMKMHSLTRFCAAFFGVAIIGCGAPIFCVIVKTSLYASRTCNGRWAFFIGAVLPYCVSWMMYQGTALITVLNWTGLVVNGVVAFVLPLVLVLYALHRKQLDHFRRIQISRLEALGILALAPDTWNDGSGRDSHNGGIGMITFHENKDHLPHATIERYQQPLSTNGGKMSSEKDHIPSPYPKQPIDTRVTHTQPTGVHPHTHSHSHSAGPARALFPYDEPLPEILGEKTALTAFGTRYVTPKAPGGKGNGSGPGLASAPGLASGPGRTQGSSVVDVEAGHRSGLGSAPGPGLGSVVSVVADKRHDDHDDEDGDSICVDEGYGHDALDHYDYDAVDQDRDAALFVDLDMSYLDHALNDHLNQRVHFSTGSTPTNPSPLLMNTTDKETLEKVKKVLGLDEHKMSALIRFARHTHRQPPYSHDSTVHPLPRWLEPYRRALVTALVIAFSLIILATIVMTALAAVFPADSTDDAMASLNDPMKQPPPPLSPQYFLGVPFRGSFH